MLYEKSLVLLIIIALAVPFIFLIKIYITVVLFLLSLCSKTFVCTYIIVYLVLYEFIIFFTPPLIYKTIKYDFVTDKLYFYLQPKVARWVATKGNNLKACFSKPLNEFNFIIYDEDFIWHKFKEEYRRELNERKKKISLEYLWQRHMLFMYPSLNILHSIHRRITGYYWFDIVGSLTITIMLLFSIPFKVCLTFVYTAILLYQILISKLHKGTTKIYRLYIHELFLSYKWFKFVLPKTTYTYIIARGESFYIMDWEIEVTGVVLDWMRVFPIYHFNRGLFDPIVLYLVFNIFVEPYYTAFRRVECLIQLMSGKQHIYTTRITHRFEYGPDDLRNISLPSLRNRLNPHNLTVRFLSGTLFILLEHVRVTYIFVSRFYQAMLCRSLSSLTIHEPLHEGFLHMRSKIFTTSEITRSSKCETIYSHGRALITNKSDLRADKIILGERVFIAVHPSKHTYISRPDCNWEFYGGYSHLVLADIVFKLDWKYLFRNTDNAKDRIETIRDSWG